MFYKKTKILILVIFSLFLFPFELNRTEAASTTLSKTAEFFIGQDGTARASGAQFSFYFNNVIIPETPTVKSAIIEINGASYNNSGNQIINADLKQGIVAAGVGTDYVLSGTTNPRPFTIRYDACVYDNILQRCTGSMSNIVLANTVYDYTLYLKDTSGGGSASFSIASAKLILTYNSSSSGTEFLKTAKFFVGQENGLTASGIEVSKNFTLTIPEQMPAIRSIFVEVSGIAKGSGLADTIGLSVVNQGLPASYANYTLDLSATASNTRFVARYDASSAILSADFPGSKSYTFYYKGTGFSAYLLNAKLIVTYKYTQSSGGLPAKGELISSTFDTGVAKGAAYNSLTWKGTLNSGQVGQVGLQIAASDSIAGPWLFEGPDCTSGTSYVSDADKPIPIETGCAPSHNNKRYFRYKVIICSNIDCVTSGATNPQVDEVVVNWSP